MCVYVFKAFKSQPITRRLVKLLAAGQIGTVVVLKHVHQVPAVTRIVCTASVEDIGNDRSSTCVLAAAVNLVVVE